MEFKKLLFIWIAIIVLCVVIPMASATLTIQGNYNYDENFTYMYKVFDNNGAIVSADCNWELYNGNTLYADGVATTFVNNNITTGDYIFNIWCNATDNGTAVGGFNTIDFTKNDVIMGTEWTCPVGKDWTFPIILILLSVIIMLIAIAYETPIFGIIGGLMFTFSYFYIGACSPLLMSPVLIVGLLLTFRLALL